MSLNTPAGVLREMTREVSARMVNPAPGIDVRAAEEAVRSLLVALGHDPEAGHLRQTPRRVAAAYSELLTRGEFELTTFENEEGCDQLVLARDIPFHSLCEHHLLPFFEVAHVGYLPSERIVGLSKLARAVEGFARGLRENAAARQEFYALTRAPR